MASNAKNIAELLNTDTTVKVGDLEDGSITTAKLADDAVTSAKLGASAVDATALASNAVTTAKVADGAVTQAKTTGVAGRVGRNMIINGAMNVAQRGTSQTDVGATAKFTCDRWKASGTSSGRLTMSQIADGPVGFANCLKLDCTTADTSIAAGEFLTLAQAIEGQNLQSIGKGVTGAKEFTVSFYVKASGVFTFGFELYDADNSRHNCRTFSTTTSWVRHSFVIQADVDDGSSPFDDDNGPSMYFQFWLHAGSNSTSGTLATNWADYNGVNRAVGIDSFYSSTDNNFFVTGVQIEVGSQATDFEFEDFGETLRKCQRYYVRAGGTNYASIFGAVGWANTTGSWIGFGNLPVPMRASFSTTVTGTVRIQNGQAGYNASSISANLSNANHTGFSMGCNASGLTLYRAHDMDASGSAGLVEFDAEL